MVLGLWLLADGFGGHPARLRGCVGVKRGWRDGGWRVGRGTVAVETAVAVVSAGVHLRRHGGDAGTAETLIFPAETRKQS